MTLAAQISADVSTVFLNTDDFAIALRHYPDGDKGGPSHAVTGLLMVDEAQSGNNLGGNALDADGLVPWNERGVSERESGTIELPRSEEITESRGIEPSSLFLASYLSDGVETQREYWRVVRIIGHDQFMQTVLVVLVDRHVTRRAMRQ